MKLAQRYEKLKRDYEILKAENDKLREENNRLKQHTVAVNDKLTKVKAIVATGITGIGGAKAALEKFNWNEKMAYEYLLIRGDCVARKRKDGQFWTDQDYINYINNKYKENK